MNITQHDLGGAVRTHQATIRYAHIQLFRKELISPKRDMLSSHGLPDREDRKAKEGGEEEGKRREGWRGCWEGSLKNSE